MQNEIIFELNVRTQKAMIPVVTEFVRKTLEAQKIRDDSILEGIEHITDEACFNVITHAYEGRGDETYRISLEKYGSQIIMAIEDHGLPMNFENVQAGKQEGFGYKIIKAFADNIKYINLGKSGKRIEYIKDLSLLEIPKELAEASSDEIGHKDEIAPLDTPLEFRLLRSDEGIGLARCLYRVYGFTYKDFVYYPEKIKTMIEDGRLVSMVAVNPEGEIVAHQGLIKSHRDSKNAEIGMGAVDPRYRGRKLFEKIKEISFNHIRQQGVVGLFCEAVTIHPYSQKANIATGSKETGIMLGYVPSGRNFKGINSGGNDNKRFATVLMYNRILKEPKRTVWIPEELKEVAGKIYEHGSFQRVFGVSGVNQDDDELTQADFTVYNDNRLAIGCVKKYGQDLTGYVVGKTKELCNASIECIFLDLPLSRPETMRMYPELKKKGFFFCGIVPELEGEDYLRVQYLNNVNMAKEDIVLASDFSKYLLEVIWSGYEGYYVSNKN